MSTVPIFARIGVGGISGGGGGFLPAFFEEHLDLQSEMEFYNEEGKKSGVQGPLTF